MTATMKDGKMHIVVDVFPKAVDNISGKSLTVLKESSPRLIIPGLKVNGEEGPVTLSINCFKVIPENDRAEEVRERDKAIKAAVKAARAQAEAEYGWKPNTAKA